MKRFKIIIFFGYSVFKGYKVRKRVMINNGWEFNEMIKGFWNVEVVFKGII